MDDKQKAKDEAFREYLLNDPASKAGDKYPFMRGWDEHAAASAQPATEWVDVNEEGLNESRTNTFDRYLLGSSNDRIEKSQP